MTKPTHEELCELWQRGFRARCDYFRWLFFAKEIAIWIEEMEERYGDED